MFQDLIFCRFHFWSPFPGFMYELIIKNALSVVTKMYFEFSTYQLDEIITIVYDFFFFIFHNFCILCASL